MIGDETVTMDAREGREECLEALYRLERAGHATTWRALEGNPDLQGFDIPATLLELVERGHVRIKDGAIGLLQPGRVLGRRIFRRHEFVEGLFRVLGLRRERAHREACRMEHLMALPGEKIPGLSERGQLSLVIDLLERGAVPLSQGQCGPRYRLGMICAGRGARRKLEDMGVSGGTEITLCSRQRRGPVEISVRGSRLALGRGIASKVLVIPAEDDRTEKRHQRGPGLERHAGHGFHGRRRNLHAGHHGPYSHR